MLLVSGSFWWLQAFLGLWNITSVFGSISTWLSALRTCLFLSFLCSVFLYLSFMRILVIGFRIHPDNPGGIHVKVLTLRFIKKVTFVGFRNISLGAIIQFYHYPWSLGVVFSTQRSSLPCWVSVIKSNVISVNLGRNRLH